MGLCMKRVKVLPVLGNLRSTVLYLSCHAEPLKQFESLFVHAQTHSLQRKYSLDLILKWEIINTSRP